MVQARNFVPSTKVSIDEFALTSEDYFFRIKVITDHEMTSPFSLQNSFIKKHVPK